MQVPSPESEAMDPTGAAAALPAARFAPENRQDRSPPVTVVNPTPAEELARVVEPFLRQWAETTTEQQRLRLEHEDKRQDREVQLEQFLANLQSQTVHHFTTIGTIIVGVLLAIAIGLFVAGRDAVATEIIRMTIAGGLGFLGGIGAHAAFQRRERRTPEPNKQDD